MPSNCKKQKLDTHGKTKKNCLVKSGFLKLNLGIFLLAVHAILKVDFFTCFEIKFEDEFSILFRKQGKLGLSDIE